MATVRDAIALAESGRADAARQAFARHVADGAPQAHKSYAIFLQQRGERPRVRERRSCRGGGARQARACSREGVVTSGGVEPAAGRAALERCRVGGGKWEARDGGGFELRINS
jgi:hypothetical protein